MKKTTLIILSLVFTGLAHAHSQGPVNFGGKENPTDSITISGIVEVPISVGAGEHSESFDIIVDGNTTPYTSINVMQNKIRKLKVPVKLNKPNTVESHTVCSISTAGTYRTEICTKAKLYWLKK